MRFISLPYIKLSFSLTNAFSSIIKGSFLNTVTKSMVNSLIKNAALELASFGVRVNGVAPGVTNTNLRIDKLEEPKERNNQIFLQNTGMNNLLSKNVLQPGDIVDTMLFLASDDAGFMTGEIIKIDNGYSLNHDLCFSEGDISPM